MSDYLPSDYHAQKIDAARRRHALILEERERFNLPLTTDELAGLTSMLNAEIAYHQTAGVNGGAVAIDNDALAARQRAIRQRQDRP